MRARIQLRRAFFLSVLFVGYVLIAGRPAQAGPVQDQTQSREDWLKQRELEERRQIEERRRAADAAKAKEAATQQQQQHAPEIDASSIPTALALMSASVFLLRARLRSK